MNPLLETMAIWLADYYVLSTTLLLPTCVALAGIRQPARRRAVTQSTLVALIVLALLLPLPGWSMLSLLNGPDASPPIATSAADNLTTRRVASSAQAAAVIVVSPTKSADIGPAPALSPLEDINQRPRATWQVALVAAWAIGAMCVLIWLALGSLNVRRLLRSARVAAADVHALMREAVGSEFDKFRDVRLMVSSQIHVAVAIGVRQPIILMPENWTTNYSPLKLRSVLAHELAHVQNNDLRWLAASRAILVLLWAQPLYWLLRCRMRLDQEALADAAAAELTSRQSYAEQLLAWARDIAARPAMWLTPAVGLWEGPTQLRQRIALLIDERFTVLRSCSRAWRLTAVGVCGALAVTLSLVTFEPAQPQNPGDNPKTEVNRKAPKSEGVTVVCVDREGKPVAGAEVHLFQYNRETERYVYFGPESSDQKGNARFGKAITDKEGNFDRYVYARVPGRLVGVLHAIKWKENKAINPDMRVALQPSRSVEGQVTVPPGTNPEDITVVVRTMYVIDGPLVFDSELSVHIFEHETFYRTPGIGGLDAALPEIFERQPDANGRIRFDDMPVAGRLWLVSRCKGLGEAQWRNDGDSFDKPIELRFEKEARLYGRVLLPDGKPAGGMNVDARISSSRAVHSSTFSAQTAENGEFVIYGLPDMEFTLSIKDPDRQWVFRPVQNLHIRPGGFEDQTFTLEAGVKVSGRVVDQQGKPLEGAHLSAVVPKGERPGLGHDSTDVDGRFELRLPAGAAGLYFSGGLPADIPYPRPSTVKDLRIQAGQAPIENLTITLHRKPKADESVADAEAPDDEEDEPKSNEAAVQAKPRRFVRLVAGPKNELTFEGEPIAWDNLASRLEQVPKRSETVLEFAISSRDISVREMEESQSRAMGYARKFGFLYGSYIGVHALGSKGTFVASDLPATDESAKATKDDGDEQGSQMLRDIRAKSAPILAAMAKEHGYGLPAGKDLVRVAPPFPDIRMEYYRTGHPTQSEHIPAGPSAMVFRWEDGRLQNWGMTFGDPVDGGYDLTDVLDTLADIKSQQIEGPRELLTTRLPGDWVIRKGAAAEDIVKQLQAILQNEFSLPIKLEFREVERPVYVARGEYEFTPLPGQPGKGKLILTDETITTDEIQIFGRELVPNSGAGGGTDHFDEFLNWLGRWIKTPIVSEVERKPTNQLSWHLHERSPSTDDTRDEDHDPNLVLPNITAQTGLVFTLEKRPVRILFVERTTPPTP